MIYEKRPMVCRDYGLIDALPCPYFRKDGTKRGFTERKIVEMTINKTVDDAIRRLK
jgi:Fe-S-cluster containining protein